MKPPKENYPNQQSVWEKATKYLVDTFSTEPCVRELTVWASLAEGTFGLYKDFYEPLWYSLTELPGTLLYPLEIRDWLIEDVKNGFSSTTREATFKIVELRQAL